MVKQQCRWEDIWQTCAPSTYLDCMVPGNLASLAWQNQYLQGFLPIAVNSLCMVPCCSPVAQRVFTSFVKTHTHTHTEAAYCAALCLHSEGLLPTCPVIVDQVWLWKINNIFCYLVDWITPSPMRSQTQIWGGTPYWVHPSLVSSFSQKIPYRVFCGFFLNFILFIFLYSTFLLVINFIHISVYMSIPIARVFIYLIVNPICQFNNYFY